MFSIQNYSLFQAFGIYTHVLKFFTYHFVITLALDCLISVALFHFLLNSFLGVLTEQRSLMFFSLVFLWSLGYKGLPKLVTKFSHKDKKQLLINFEAGKFGRLLSSYLDHAENSEILCFADDDPTKDRTRTRDYNTLSPTILQSYFDKKNYRFKSAPLIEAQLSSIQILP